MNIWEETVLTDKGALLHSKLVDGQTLKITSAKTGAGRVPAVNLRGQTSVTAGGKKISLQPSRTEGNRVVIPVLLENKGLEEGYELWQVGFYAEDPDEGEILYCISQASKGKNIPAESESPGFSITWDFYFQTSNSPQFEILVDSKGLVSMEEYQIHTHEIEHLKNSIGKLEDLKTGEKSSITGAVNEVSDKAVSLGDGLNLTNQTLQNTNNDIRILQGKTDDTGWLDMPLESGITSPGTAGSRLRYRKKNGIVFITGTVKVTGKAAGTLIKICQLPVGFRSSYEGYYYFTNTATGYVTSRYIIGSDGAINLEWVRKLSDGSELTGTINWVGIDISYPV
ncbi:hypothetical protein [Anaerostipes sp.]|uniref:hypothetical protein n=1 Tax=Anaerostipes sp. TaxID=1872530 RepID=UPI0025BC82DE|nr:hypothetical protein [Anaerostipes sp.]